MKRHEQTVAHIALGVYAEPSEVAEWLLDGSSWLKRRAERDASVMRKKMKEEGFDWADYSLVRCSRDIEHYPAEVMAKIIDLAMAEADVICLDKVVELAHYLSRNNIRANALLDKLKFIHSAIQETEV